ncbi:MAG: glutamine synthetase family protein [Armatimonadetes bacterium]|nr:glutamine synthetase family protein [Armatimonadota bacterium]
MADTQGIDKEAVLRQINDGGVEFIRLWFTDIQGMLKSFAVTPGEMEEAMEEGMGFDGSSISGYQDIEESDMIAMPDPSTFQLLPWRPDGTVARMFCDVQTPTGEPYVGDPRQILRRNVQKAADLGYQYFVGPELEFFYFRNNVTPEIIDRGGYFDLTPLDAASDLRRETVQTLQQMGITVEYSHHEVAPSQHEIDLRYNEALKMADDAMTYRLVVKEVAAKYGLYATFMPKPLFGENGSGMHCHQSLFKGSENAFYDAKSPDHLSTTAKQYIAGILRHAPEIIAILAQWVNSYKRLVPGYEAPVYIAWSQRNRSALIRVPLYKPGKEKATRMELRCPDPSANPYLAFSVMLAAGLKGIQEGYEAPPDMEENLYHLTTAEREARGIHSLPSSLGEAIEITAKSELVRECLGDHAFERFVELKRAEWDAFRLQVTEWEIARYLPIL